MIDSQDTNLLGLYFGYDFPTSVGMNDDIHFGLIGGDRHSSNHLRLSTQPPQCPFDLAGSLPPTVKVLGFDFVAEKQARVV